MLIRLTVIVLFAGLLSVVPSVWAMGVVPAEKASAAITEHAPVSTCRWKTYTSEKYGFEMKYPQDLAVESEIPLAVIDGTALRLLLVNCTYYDGTNLVEAALFVGVTPENAYSSGLPTDGPQDPSQCGDPAETRNIAGVTFSRTSFWEGAAGNQYGLITYSASHGGSCYRLALFIHSTNVQVYDPGTVSEFDRAKVIRLFDQVISTFRFLK